MKLRVYNKTLDPNIWGENKTLNPEVRDVLLKIAEDFYNTTDLKTEIQNILFLGSSANYNWTPTSDIDLHVVIDIAGEKIHEDYARKFMDGLSFKWNSEHSIEVKGHPVEVYLQDVREPNSTSDLARPGAAIYSLFDDKWMLEPNPQDIKLDANKIRQKFHQLKKRINDLMETHDIDKMKKLMKSIRKYRDAGLSAGGEFGVENLVFKALRHSGDLRKLKDTIMKLYDTGASLPEGGNVKPHKKTEPLNEMDSRYYEITGMINSNLKVESEKYHGNQPWVNHVVIVNRHGFDWSDSLKWRYDSANQVVAFEDGMTPEQKTAIKEHLRTRYGIPGKGIRFAMYAKRNENQLREAEDKFLVIGFINGALEIIADVDTKDGLDHEMVLKNHPEFEKGEIADLSFWRYKSTTNILTWLLKNPSEQQRHSVVEYLHSKFSVSGVRQELGQYGGDAYRIDETTRKLVKWILTKKS